MKLTQKAVDAIGLDIDRVVWDDDTPGLGLRVQSGKNLDRSLPGRRRPSGRSRCPAASSWPGADRGAAIRTGARRGADIIADGRAAAEAAKREAEAARARSLGAIVEKYLTDAENRLRPASYRVAKLYLDPRRSTGPSCTTAPPTS